MPDQQTRSVSPDRSVNCLYCHQEKDERNCIRGPGGEGSICPDCSCSTEDGQHVPDITMIEPLSDAHHDMPLGNGQVLCDIQCLHCGRSGSFVLTVPEVNW